MSVKDMLNILGHSTSLMPVTDNGHFANQIVSFSRENEVASQPCLAV